MGKYSPIKQSTSLLWYIWFQEVGGWCSEGDLRVKIHWIMHLVVCNCSVFFEYVWIIGEHQGAVFLVFFPGLIVLFAFQFVNPSSVYPSEINSPLCRFYNCMVHAWRSNGANSRAFLLDLHFWQSKSSLPAFETTIFPVASQSKSWWMCDVFFPLKSSCFLVSIPTCTSQLLQF